MTDATKAIDRRAMVVVAHVDDDGVGFAQGLRERGEASVVYLTDSAPRDPHYFVTPAASREAYAAARRGEAHAVATLLGRTESSLFFLDAPDMEAFRNIARLEIELQELAERLRPQVLWSLSYDGGHPDHDVAAFLTTRLAARLEVPHCEFALYSFHRGFQPFRFGTGAPGHVRRLDGDEQTFKRALLDTYSSQTPLLSRVLCDRERYRVAPPHDFTRRPVPRTLYETWNWPMTAEMLLEAFAAAPKP